MSNKEDTNAWIVGHWFGKTVKQVRASAPEFQHNIGRVSKVVNHLWDEKGVLHLNTEDGFWCPAELLDTVSDMPDTDAALSDTDIAKKVQAEFDAEQTCTKCSATYKKVQAEFDAEQTCTKCSATYTQREIAKHFGSDHKKWCLGCITKWKDDAKADPYRVGLAFLRCDSPEHMPDDLVERYKTAFELTNEMLKTK